MASRLRSVPLAAHSPSTAVTSGHSASPWASYTTKHTVPKTLTSELDQTIRLSDGRTLGFAEFGSPAGYPLFFFHGWPSSRLEAWGLDDLAKRQRVRVIAPERPGYGLSTLRPSGTSPNAFQPRRITDWPSDVRALAEHLKLNRFAILGGSGGGPFALACAHALPSEMMSSIGLISSAGPWYPEPLAEKVRGEGSLPDDLVKNVHWLQRAISFAAIQFPSLLAVATNGLVGLSRRVVATRMVRNWLYEFLETAATSKEKDSKSGDGAPETDRSGAKEKEPKEEKDGASLTTEEQQERLLRIVFEAFAQGSEGMVHEAKLLSQPWGLTFEEITYNGIQIWHGTKDANAPINQIRYMADRIPNCSLHEFSDDNHFAVGNRLEEIFSKLIPN